MNAPHEYVKTHFDFLADLNRKGVRVLGDPTAVYDFLLTHGVEWKGDCFERSRFKRKGYFKQCFRNAYLRARRHPSLSYVEGFAFAGLLAVHHAWNVDEHGRVIDFTWRDDAQRSPAHTWEYFGVPIKVEHPALIAWHKLQPVYGFLFSWPHHKIRLDTYVKSITEE